MTTWLKCGDCGAFLPDDAVSCPKCDMEIEHGVVKCSICEAWVPLDSPSCQICGARFETARPSGLGRLLGKGGAYRLTVRKAFSIREMESNL